MILEMAHIEVKAGAEPAFEAAVAQAAPLFAAARGCQGMELHRVVEAPRRYILMVRWATLEDHTVHFRESEAFQQWRALAGPHFAAAPTVEHTAVVFPAG
ncbi:MAG: antibiotic biosynthesis monooxygenase [Phenylobacterium sp.]|uniref:antibiotic biosynthesis monooxygenase family protein n=1 Tax=Phenylobacterium sp. TaxID=1871053 RepID=UPI00120124FE|nr:antibiotic biosynthesis monooxygenase [Phenylobacterium sp.]TAJ74711.1 MAG: antibiotic biosynthesis monooxygenase [Phenylobacterium sp.]